MAEKTPALLSLLHTGNLIIFHFNSIIFINFKRSQFCNGKSFHQVGNFLVMSLIPIVLLTILNFLIYKGIHRHFLFSYQIHWYFGNFWLRINTCAIFQEGKTLSYSHRNNLVNLSNTLISIYKC